MDGILLSQIIEPVSATYMEHEYLTWKARLNEQPVITRRFLESDAQVVAGALIDRLPQARFTLPDKVELEGKVSASVPVMMREQIVGGLVNRFSRANLNNLVRARLDELQASQEPALATSAGLLRNAIAMHLVYRSLPDGRSVVYTTSEGEEIPTIPLEGEASLNSAITASADAVLMPEETPAEDTILPRRAAGAVRTGRSQVLPAPMGGFR